jgi:hypothetical protein
MTFFMTLSVFACVVLAYVVGSWNGRHDDAAIKEHRSSAVNECMHAIARLEDDQASFVSAAYSIGVRDAQRAIVERWLAEMEVETCPSVDEIAGVLSAARREADPEGAPVECVGEPRPRSWFLNQPPKQNHR